MLLVIHVYGINNDLLTVTVAAWLQVEAAAAYQSGLDAQLQTVRQRSLNALKGNNKSLHTHR